MGTNGPWTEWSEVCKEMGFEPSKNDSKRAFARLLEPVRTKIADLAAKESKHAEYARKHGQTFSLEWTTILLHLDMELAEDKKEREANQDENFQFGTKYIPHEYVVIDGEEYDLRELEQVLDDLDHSDNAIATTLVPKHMEPLIERYQLGNQRAAGGWAAHDDKAEQFIDRMLEAYQRYVDNRKAVTYHRK